MTSSSHPRSGRASSAAAIILAALAVASAFVTPASRDLIFGDESRYARVAAEMSARGEWLVPSLDGRPYTEKPPLHFDAIVALGRVLGFHTTWTFVLPSLIAFVLLTAGVGIAAWRWFGAAAGGLAAFLFATFLFPWGSAQTARMDLEYALLTTATMILLYEAMARGSRPLMLASGAAAGAAILVKGPAVAAIAILVWAAESVRRRRRPRWEDAGALLLALAIPAAWVGVIAARQGGWVAFDLVVTQNLGRAVSSFAHAKPFWFYAARFPLLFFPWFVLLLPALAGLRSRRDDGPYAFCALWFGAIFLFFSAISGKLEVYLLPAAAPAAMLLGAWLASSPTRRTVLAMNVTLLAVAAVVFLSVPAIVAARAGSEPEVDLLLASRFGLVAVIAALAAAAAAILHTVPRAREPVASVLLTGAALMVAPVAAAFLMMDVANAVYSSRPLVDQLRARGLERATLVVYEGFHPWGRDYDFDAVERIREADPWTLKKTRTLPEVVVTRASRATELGPPLRTSYEKIASIRIRRKEYEVYALRR